MKTMNDIQKRVADFLIISTGSRYAIAFNKPTVLKESRGITRATDCVYYVTKSALSRLKEKYTWSTDF